MTEKSGVWEPLRNACPQVMWSRIENLVGTGMPDVNGVLNGVEIWIENKLVRGWRISFRPMQPAWILKRVGYGGRVFVLARKEDTLYLWFGSQVKDLVKADIRTVPPVLTLQKPFDWDLLIETLFCRSTHSLMKGT